MAKRKAKDDGLTQTMIEGTETSLIVISDLGPVEYFEFQLLPKGGILELHGDNGIGKSHVQRAVSALFGADVNLSVRDGQELGSVSLGKGRVRVATRQTRSGGDPTSLGVLHLEDQYSIDKLINPGLKDEVRNDQHRIKTLVQLSGGTVPWSSYEELVSHDAGYDRVSIEEAKEIGDTVAKNEAIKVIFERAARQVEASREEEQKRQAACVDAFPEIDVTAPHDEKALSEAVTAAIRFEEKLKSRKVAHDRAIELRTQAEAQLKRPRENTVADATSKLVACEAELEAATLSVTLQQEAIAGHDTEIDRLKGLIKDEETKRALAVKERETRQKSVDHAADNVAAANRAIKTCEEQDQRLAELSGVLERDIPDDVDDDDLEGAAFALTEAQQAQTLGVLVRKALEKREEAKKHKEQYDKHDARATKLRNSARCVEELLSEAVNVPQLKIEAGRLVLRETSELFERLSDGERARIAVEIACLRVSEQTGDGSRLSMIPQAAWQDLQPKVKKLVRDTFATHGVTGVAAVCSDGPLEIREYTGEEE